MSPEFGGNAGLTRRRVLAGLLLLPPALAGCSLGGTSSAGGPDPLVALADAARADAALAAAAIAASPELAEAVQPLVDARTMHASALDAEVARLAPAGTTPTAPAAPAATAPGATLPAVRAAVLASAQAASAAVLELPVERVGLTASVAACCSTYAEVLR